MATILVHHQRFHNIDAPLVRPFIMSSNLEESGYGNLPLAFSHGHGTVHPKVERLACQKIIKPLTSLVSPVTKPRDLPVVRVGKSNRFSGSSVPPHAINTGIKRPNRTMAAIMPFPGMTCTFLKLLRPSFQPEPWQYQKRNRLGCLWCHKT